MVRVSAIQLMSKPDVGVNLRDIDQQLAKITIYDNHIVLLPECCLFFGGKDSQQLELAKETYKNNKLVEELGRLATKYKITLVAGSIPIYCEASSKFTNSCIVMSAAGEQVNRYDKIHLFDVEVQDSEKNYLESKYTQPGTSVVTHQVSDVNLGLSICYDLRFPELFRHLTTLGANVITVPAAFTKVTGEAHWQTLLSARAIENQVYIVAAGQQGIHANGRETWGHSMIIDPWGKIICCLEEGVGVISADIDLTHLTRVRYSIPVASHNQFTTKLKVSNIYE